MKHYKMTEWVDFVRGLGEADRAAMEQHLTSGCRECLRTVEFVREIAALAGAEARHQPPQYAVDSVKAMYVLQQPKKVHLVPAVVAQLVYDSFRDPIPAGVRVRHRISRQVLYRSGDYNLDLRLEHERGSPSLTLVGQVANQKRPAEQLADVPVFLVAGKKLVAQSATNRFGEFHLQYKPKANLQLYVPVANGKRIEVPLNQLPATRPRAKIRRKQGKASSSA